MAKCASKYDPATHEMTMPDGSKKKVGEAPAASPAKPGAETKPASY
jgi:hypothetical protein